MHEHTQLIVWIATISCAIFSLLGAGVSVVMVVLVAHLHHARMTSLVEKVRRLREDVDRLRGIAAQRAPLPKG